MSETKHQPLLPRCPACDGPCILNKLERPRGHALYPGGNEDGTDYEGPIIGTPESRTAFQRWLTSGLEPVRDELAAVQGRPADPSWDGYVMGVDLAATPRPHVHRCMRCGEEFECQSPGVCTAGYNVLPSIVVAGPDGPEVREHCPMPGRAP